jgi:hypothetical protein
LHCCSTSCGFSAFLASSAHICACFRAASACAAAASACAFAIVFFTWRLLSAPVQGPIFCDSDFIVISPSAIFMCIVERVWSGPRKTISPSASKAFSPVQLILKVAPLGVRLTSCMVQFLSGLIGRSSPPASWQNSVVRAGIDMPIISMDCVWRQRTPEGASAALAAAPMTMQPAARLQAMRLERADLVCIVRLPRWFAVGMPRRGTKGPSLPQAAGPTHFSIVKTRSALRSLPASVLMVQRSPIV